MQTYTHFLWAVVLARWLGPRFQRNPKLPPFAMKLTLFGSILPDLPLIVTTIICIVADMIRSSGDNNNSWTHQLFSTWYFQSPWVKSEHNLFHSQVSLGVLMGVTYWIWSSKRRCYNMAGLLFWMLVSAWFHATCDIPVHHEDGPLIFWPLNWNFRYYSPVSYYDPNYHGKAFSLVEHSLDVVIILAECYRCCCIRKEYRAVGAARGEQEGEEATAAINDERVELATLMDKEGLA